MIKNLVSVRQFTTDNCVSVSFDPFGFSVKDLKTGALLQRCDSVGDLYPCTPTQMASDSALTTVSLPTWHRRLGHPGSSILQFLHSRRFISSSTNKLSICHACQLGKHCRLSFSSSLSKTSRVFELIHSDLWTSSVTSLSRFKYYILFLDDFSHFYGFSRCVPNLKFIPYSVIFACMSKINLKLTFNRFNVIMDANLITIFSLPTFNTMALIFVFLVLTHLRRTGKQNDLFAQLITLFARFFSKHL